MASAVIELMQSHGDLAKLTPSQIFVWLQGFIGLIPTVDVTSFGNYAVSSIYVLVSLAGSAFERAFLSDLFQMLRELSAILVMPNPTGASLELLRLAGREVRSTDQVKVAATTRVRIAAWQLGILEVLRWYIKLAQEHLDVTLYIAEREWTSLWATLPLSSSTEVRHAALSVVGALSEHLFQRGALSPSIGYETMSGLVTHSRWSPASFTTSDERVLKLISSSFDSVPLPLRAYFLGILVDSSTRLIAVESSSLTSLTPELALVRTLLPPLLGWARADPPLVTALSPLLCLSGHLALKDQIDEILSLLLEVESTRPPDLVSTSEPALKRARTEPSEDAMDLEKPQDDSALPITQRFLNSLPTIDFSQGGRSSWHKSLLVLDRRLRVPPGLERLPTPLPTLLSPFLDLLTSSPIDESAATTLVLLSSSVCQAFLRGPSGKQQIEQLNEAAWKLATVALSIDANRSGFSTLHPELQELIFAQAFTLLGVLSPTFMVKDRRQLLTDGAAHGDVMRAVHAIRTLPLYVLRCGTMGTLSVMETYMSVSSIRKASNRKELAIISAVISSVEVHCRLLAAAPIRKEGLSTLLPLEEVPLALSALKAMPSSLLVSYQPCFSTTPTLSLRSNSDSYTPLEFSPQPIDMSDVSFVFNLHSLPEKAIRLKLIHSLARLLPALGRSERDQSKPLIQAVVALLSDHDSSIRAEAASLLDHVGRWANDFMAPMRELYRREFNRPEVIHTLLRAYGNLSTHLDKDSLAAVLTLLTKNLVDPHPTTRGVAFCEIGRIAAARKTDPKRLFFEQFGQELFPMLLLEVHNRAPLVASVVQALFGLELDAFVKSTLPLALPQLVLRLASDSALANKGILQNLVERAKGQQLAQLLLENMHDILGTAFSGPDEDVASVSTFLCTVLSSTIKDLLLSCVQKLLALLIFNMGRPERQAREKGHKPLVGLAAMISSNLKQKVDPADVVREHFLIIIHSLKTIFTRQSRPLHEREQAVRALGALVDFLQPSSAAQFIKVMSTLKMIPETEREAPSLMPLALVVWEGLIRRLPHDLLGRELPEIVAELLVFLEAHSARVTTLLRFLFVEMAPVLKPHYKHIFFLPDAVADLLPVTPAPPLERIRVLLPFIDPEKNRPLRVRLLALEKLAHILNECGESPSDLARLLIATPLADEIAAVISVCLRGIRDSDPRLRLRCAEVLGRLGAINPQRLKFPQAAKPDFSEKRPEEISRLVLEGPLVSTYRHATDSTVLDCAAYAIQELLKSLGCDDSTLNRRGNEQGLAFWDSLSEETREMVESLLSSGYFLNDPHRAIPSGVLWKPGTEYTHWLEQWMRRLISQTANARHVKALRTALRDVPAISHLILPHTLLLVLERGDPAALIELKDEILAVLKAHSASSNSAADRSHAEATERIFAALDYLKGFYDGQKQSMQHQANQRRVRHGAYAAIEQLLKSVPPSLQSHAAASVRDWARALREYEAQVREEGTAPVFETMQRLYAGLDDLDAIAGLDTLAEERPGPPASLQERIGRWEAAGDWDRALIGLDEALHTASEADSGRRPSISGNSEAWPTETIHEGRLRALFHSGRHREQLDLARGLNQQAPSPAYRSAAVQAAWRLGEWGVVEQLLPRVKQAGWHSLPGALNAASQDECVASLLVALRRDPSSIKALLEGARQQALAHMPAVGQESFERAAPLLRELHVYAEIEEAARILSFTETEQRERGDRLLPVWINRLERTQPTLEARELLLHVRLHVASLLHFDAELPRRYLDLSRAARAEGLPKRAYAAVLRAEREGCRAAAPSLYHLEHAKSLWALGEEDGAIQALRLQFGWVKEELRKSSEKERAGGPPPTGVQALMSSVVPSSANSGNAYGGRENEELVLCLAKWLEKTARDAPDNISEMYSIVSRTHPLYEKAFFRFARFHDSRMEELKRSRAAGEQVQYYASLPNCLTNYSLACLYGNEYVHRALPVRPSSFYQDQPRLTCSSHIMTPPYPPQRLLTLLLDYFDAVVIAAANPSSQASPDITQQIHSVAKRVVEKLKPNRWIVCLPQVASRAIHKDRDVMALLERIVIGCLREYPYQAIWHLIGFRKYSNAERRALYSRVRKAAIAASPEAQRVIEETEAFADAVLRIGEHQTEERHLDLNTTDLRDVLARPFNVLVPYQQHLTLRFLASVNRDKDAMFDRPVTVQRIRCDIKVFHSKQKPKLFTIEGNDGKSYPIIVKIGDDLRKDSRVMEFGAMMNRLLLRAPETAQRQLHIRVYWCAPLSESNGLIEVIPDVTPLRDVLMGLYKEDPSLDLAAMKQKQTRLYTGADVLTAEQFQDLRRTFPPVLHRWFLRTFPQPDQWYAARQAYVRSVAVMSMFGYVVGLGDRHGENLLCDSRTGEIVHVDFGVLFWVGQLLAVPETVPFRLTHNMVDALGLTGVEGPLRRSCEATLRIFRRHKETLKAILETFVHDPLLEWAKRQQPTSAVTVTARHHMQGVEDRLNGKLRDLQNSGLPNSGKPHAALPALNVQGQVAALLKEATSVDNLRALYKGWASYL